MSILVLGPAEEAAIKRAVDYARAHVIPWSHLKDAIDDDRAAPRDVLKLEDRKPGFERPESEHIMLGTYRCSISFEEQPAGILRHLSISSHRRGRIPGEEVIAMVLPAFGFSVPIENGKIWLEEFLPGWMAVNFVEVVQQ